MDFKQFLLWNWCLHFTYRVLPVSLKSNLRARITKNDWAILQNLYNRKTIFFSYLSQRFTKSKSIIAFEGGGGLTYCMNSISLISQKKNLLLCAVCFHFTLHLLGRDKYIILLVKLKQSLPNIQNDIDFSYPYNGNKVMSDVFLINNLLYYYR